jgi:hypothetical protein
LLAKECANLSQIIFSKLKTDRSIGVIENQGLKKIEYILVFNLSYFVFMMTYKAAAKAFGIPARQLRKIDIAFWGFLGFMLLWSVVAYFGLL